MAITCDRVVLVVKSDLRMNTARVKAQGRGVETRKESAGLLSSQKLYLSIQKRARVDATYTLL